MFSNHPSSLRNLLEERADPKTRTWWESYVKDSAPFLGVKMADIRTVVHDWHDDQIAGVFDPKEQLDIALLLFEGQFTEEKLAGTLFLQEILLPMAAVNCSNDIDRFGKLFSDGLIYDWNICDWFSIKVLGSLIEMNGGSCADRISVWHAVENLWQARASLVAFVPVAANRAFYPHIERNSQSIIKRDERFAKTAVGWILREISKHDQTLVERVINENIIHFSAESLKNATKYLNPEDKSVYRQLWRDAQTDG